MPVQEINLLGREERKGAGSRVLDWALTFGRYVVILTELIVIIAFLARFSLDRRLDDLYDSIKQKQIFLTANSEFEKEFRGVQNRMTAVRDGIGAQLGAAEILLAFARLTPADVRFVTFNFLPSGFTVRGIAKTENELGRFLRSLTGEKRITDLSVDSVRSSALGEGFEFVISGKWSGSNTTPHESSLGPSRQGGRLPRSDHTGQANTMNL